MTIAQCRWPLATRTAVAVAETRPVAVSTSAVMPWRWSASPTGLVVRSTAFRQRPSNMKTPCRALARGRRRCALRVYHRGPRTAGCGTGGLARAAGVPRRPVRAAVWTRMELLAGVVVSGLRRLGAQSRACWAVPGTHGRPVTRDRRPPGHGESETQCEQSQTVDRDRTPIEGGRLPGEDLTSSIRPGGAGAGPPALAPFARRRCRRGSPRGPSAGGPRVDRRPTVKARRDRLPHRALEEDLHPGQVHVLGR